MHFKHFSNRLETYAHHHQGIFMILITYVSVVHSFSLFLTCCFFVYFLLVVGRCYFLVFVLFAYLSVLVVVPITRITLAENVLNFTMKEKFNQMKCVFRVRNTRDR